MVMSNWSMIYAFVLNLVTTTVLILVICKLTYCIEFTKFVYFIFFIDQWIFVFIFSEQLEFIEIVSYFVPK